VRRCASICILAFALPFLGACAPKGDPNAVADATAARGPDTEEAAAALMRGGQTVGYTGEDDIVAGYPEPPRPSRETASEPKKAPAAADDDRADPVALTPGESAAVRRTATRTRSAPRKVADTGDATGRSESDDVSAGSGSGNASSSATRRRPRLRPVPVDLAAAPLFGMWRVDTERSDPTIATYERIWFSPDGRCRGWSNGTSADATWTWQPKEGVIVVGLDSMGSEFPTFTWLGGTLELVDIDDRKIVLVPDRLFVKPAPLRGAS
jgi:hypothetical protein